jgi:membrane-bound lytic murein transglycosylase F
VSDNKQKNKRVRRIRIIGILVAVILSIPVLFIGFREDQTLLEKIQDSGRLTMVTYNGPTTYFEDRHGPGGFEYDLVNAFAESLDVDLVIKVAEQFDQIMPDIRAGHADIAAAGLSITGERKKQFLFSDSYQKIKQQVVYRSGATKRPRKASQLVQRDIMVTANSSHAERLAKLKEKHPELSWRETSKETPESLLVKVWEKELELTIADSNILAVVRQYHPELQVALSLPPADELAWMFTLSNDRSLVDAANKFLKSFRKSGKLDRLLDRYYGHSSKFDYVNTKTFLDQIDHLLPVYEDMFRRAESKTGIDWRLLAAQAYQESKWNAEAVSPTGVRGIMMLTRDTAKRMKIDDRRDPEKSIEGGSRYLKLLYDGLPERIKDPDRMWIALAAYNVGLGHLEDARILTQKQGGDADIWLDIQKHLPLLAKPEWHKKTRYGYARGYEPVAYVNRIRGYYEILSWYDDQRKDPASQINDIDLPAL